MWLTNRINTIKYKQQVLFPDDVAGLGPGGDEDVSPVIDELDDRLRGQPVPNLLI